MLRLSLLAPLLLAGAAAAEVAPASAVRDWPSARFRGSVDPQPPCSCRSAAGSVEVGRQACVPGPAGGRLALCEMAENNTSWRFTGESCGPALTQ